MAQTIKLKRSATQGAVPSTSALALGEIAINTYDGNLFIKKNDGSESIVTIGGLADNAVTSAKIAANAVEASEIATNAVGISELNVSDGTSGHVLTTDGAGSLSFTSKVSTAQSFYLNSATGDGSTTDFSLSTTPAAESNIIAFIDGVFQTQDSYTFSGTTLSFSSAPPNGTEVTVYVVGAIFNGNSVVLDTFSGDNSTTQFTLSENPENENNTQVYIDGVYQQKSEYSVSSQTLTFSSAPPTGTNNIEVVAFSVTNLTVLNANSVSSASIAANAVTSTHIAANQVGISELNLSDGTNGQYLQTDGAGTLSFSTISGYTDSDVETYLDGGTSTPTFATATVSGTANFGSLSDGTITITAFADEDNMVSNSATLVPTQQSVKAYVDASILTKDNTDEITEGSTNLYFTNARAQGAISGGTGVTVSSGTISIGQDVATSSTPTFGNITTTGYIAGPATFTIDPAAVGDNTGTVVIAGNLQVDGTTTTINSTTMEVDDLNITLASGAANAAAANGAGITVDGASATITYDGTNDEWDFNKDINVTGTVTANELTVEAASPTLILKDNDSTGAPASGLIKFNESDNSTSAQVGFGSTSNSDFDIFQAENASIDMWTNSTQRLRINGSGNIGINTTAPATLLHIKADSNSATDFPLTIENAADSLDVGIGAYGLSNKVGTSQTSDFTMTIGDDLYLAADTVRLPDGADLIVQENDSTTSAIRLASDADEGFLQVYRAGVQKVQIRGNGDNYIIDNNFGVGTASPSASLHVNSGTVNIASIFESTDVTTQVSFKDTNQESQILVTDGETRISADVNNENANSAFTVRIDNTERMRIDSAGMGINQSAPTQQLVVKDATDYHGILVHGNNAPNISFDRGDTQTPEWKVGVSGNTGTSFAISKGTANDDKLTIASTGNVGIGTGSPTAKLHVATAGAEGINIGLQNNERYWNMETDGGLLMWKDISAGGLTRMAIDTSGNVGIGQASDGDKLHVLGTGFFEDARGNGVGVQINGGSSSEFAHIGVSASNPLTFQTANTERVRIHGDGDATIGTTSSTANFYNGAGSETGHGFHPTGYGCHVRGGVLTPLYVSHSGTGSGQFIAFSQSTTGRGYINWTGTTLQLTSTSDHRLKENVVPISNATTRINALNPISYDMIENGESAEGFLAHELQEHVPHAVTGTHNEVYTEADLNEEDLEDLIGTPKYQTVSYASLTPLLVKALQEANAKIEALEARITTLENA